MPLGQSFDPSTVPVFSNVLNRDKPAERSPFKAGLVRVGAELSNNVPLVVEKALGTLTPEREASYQQGLQRGLARSDQLLPGGPMSIDQVRGVGDVGTLIKENLLYSLPQMGASVGGALIARRSPFAGATVAGTPFYIGSNVTRATEGGTKRLENDALARSVAVAPFQALADTAAERFLPGAGRLFGDAAARQTGNFLQRTGKSILKAGLTEGATETAQQAGERFAAGLVLTNPEAAREYVQSFGTAFFVGGAMGSMGGFRSATPKLDPHAPTEDIKSVVDQQLQLPPPGQSGLVAPNARMEVDPEGNAAVVPDQGGHVVVNPPEPYQPFRNVTDPELQSAVNALSAKDDLSDEQKNILQLAQAELQGRQNVNGSATATNALSEAETVEPNLTGQSGGAAQNSTAPVSPSDILKGISTRKSYIDAESVEDIRARLQARLEAGSTAKGDFILAERLGVDTNAPAAPVEAAETRVQNEAGAQAPVDTAQEIARVTPEPAAPASQGGGDTSVDPEFAKWWVARKRGQDKAVRALKPRSYEDLDNQLFRELGEPRNTETLFSKSDHLEKLAADRGILDDKGDLTEKGMAMAVEQGIVPPTINEAQSQEIIKRRQVAKPIPIPEQAPQQQLVNEAIDNAGLQPAKSEGDIAALKRMVRDGDIEGAMMGLRRVQRGESLFQQPEPQASTYKGNERAAGVVNRERIQSARLAQQDLEFAQGTKNRASAEAAIQKFELQQSIDAAAEKGLIDRKQQIKLVGQLRQGRFAEVANAVPVVKADPMRATPVTERVQRRQALVSDLHDALAEALKEAEVSELAVDDNGLIRQQQVKVARRDFLAGVAASAAVGLPTQAKAAMNFTPVKAGLQSLLQTGNALSVLQHIQRNSSDPSYRLLAAKLARGDWSKVTIVPHDYEAYDARATTQLNDDGSTTVDIFSDGMNEQTILHELIHAYVQQRWGPISLYVPSNKAKFKDTKDRGDEAIYRFQDVWDKIGQVLKDRGLVQKALDGSERDVWAMASYEKPDEMLSWVLTNPDAQAFLKSIDADGNVISQPKPKSQMSLWDKIVEFFAELFGSNTPKMRSALDDVLAAGYAVIDAGANVQTGDFNVKLAQDVARRAGRMEMAKGPPRSAADFATVAQDATSKLSQAANEYIDKTALKDKALRTAVGWMPLTHVVKRFGDQFQETSGENGLQQLFDAHANRRATTAVFAHLFDVPKNIADRFNKTKAGQAAIRLTNEIMELTAWDIDPTKPWEENEHLHEYSNVARLKELWAEGNRKYNLLKKDGHAELYDTYRQLNELERFAGMALAIRQMVIADPTLKAELPFFEDDPDAAFRNDAALHNPIAAKRYWRDVLDSSVKEAGDYLENLRGTQEEKASTYSSPLETYLKDVKKSLQAMAQAPYFHLGRHGNHVVAAKVRLGADNKVDGDAIERIARELEKLNIKNARVTRDLEHPTVFLRVEKVGQREAVKELFLRLENEGVLQHNTTKAHPRETNEWLPERLKEEVKKFANAMQAQLEINDQMSDKEKEAILALRKRAESVARDVYLDMLPDSAMSKVLTHRDSVPGFDKDMARNFAFRYNIGVNSLASMAAAPYIDKAFQLMRGRMNEARDARSGLDVDAITTLYGEMAQREENLSRMAGDSSFDQWRAVTHAYFLGLSPSYALVNMTQVPVLLWPELAKKHGFVGAAKAMAKVTPLAFRIMKETFAQGLASGGTLRAADTMITPEVLKAVAGSDESLLNFLQHMVGSGIIDIGSSARELGTIAEGKGDDRVQKGLRYAASVGLYSETLTRLIAALAARDLHKGDFQSTVDYAKDVVRESMFEYSTFNTPRLMGKMGFAGKFTPVMTQFMQYSTQLTFKLYRELHAAMGGDADARRFLLSHLTAVTALAGTLGMPFATAAAWALEKLVDALDDDDEPYDATAALRNFAADIFGPQLGDMISRGIPRAGGYGFDISQRVGEQNLLPFSQWLTDKREMKDASAEAALRSLGAPMSMAFSVGEGFGKLADGKFMDAMIAFVPSALKGPAKAYQMTEDGYMDTLGNKLPMTPNATSYMMQLMGLNPAVKAAYAEERGDHRARETVLTQRAGVLRNRMVNAVIDGDRDAMGTTWQEIIKFNDDHPGSKFVITPQEIENSIRRRMKLQATSEQFNLPIGVKPEDARARELTRYSPIEYTAQ